MQKQKQKKRTRRNKSNPYGASGILSRLANSTGPSLRGQEQAVTELVIRGTPHLLTSTVTTGKIAFALKLDPCADIESFTTRFGADYEEVRLLGCEVRTIATQNSFVSGGSSDNGVSAIWIDEKYSSAPTALETTGKSVIWLKNTGTVKQQETITWIPNDVADMAFVSAAAGSIGNSAYFKLYTDNANYNSPIVASSLFLVQVSYLVELRGIQE